MFGLHEKNAVARATQKAEGRDDEMTRGLWEYKFRQLRGQCFLNGSNQYQDIDSYITEAEQPAIEEKNRLETDRQRAIVYKDSDVELSRHIKTCCVNVKMSNTKQKANTWIDAKRKSPTVAKMVWVAVPNVITCRHQVILCYMDSDEQWRDASGVLMFRRVNFWQYADVPECEVLC